MTQPAAPAEPPQTTIACPACGAAAGARQRFCRACGVALAPAAARAATATLLSDDAETAERDAPSGDVLPVPSDRSAPPAVPERPGAPARPCVICGAPVPGGTDGEFCEECALPVSPPVEAAAEGQNPEVPRNRPPGGSRRRRRAALAALVLVLAGGGVALALWLTRHDDPMPGKPAADAPTRRVPAGRTPDTNATAADRAAVGAPTAPTTGAEQGASATEGADSPVGVLRSHWEAISTRRYDAAYALFSSQYKSQTTRRRWVRHEASFAPRVEVAAAKVVAHRSDGSVMVYVDLVTRDLGAAGDSSRCNRFSGRVRVMSQGGSWRYWGSAPGATFKPNGTFPKSNRRCRTLF